MKFDLKLAKQSDYIVEDIEELINDIFKNISIFCNEEISELSFSQITDFIILFRNNRISYYGINPKPVQPYELFLKLEKDLRKLRSIMLERDIKKITK